MDDDLFKTMKAACGLVETPGGGQGTAYLVAIDRMATCEHVVQSVAEGEEVIVHFGADSRNATVLKKETVGDSALLKLLGPPIDATPLPLAGRCTRKAVWDGFGFLGLAKRAGLPLTGEVLDPESLDDLDHPAMVLFSPQVAADMGAPLHGFSGSPVLVEGVVVGHIKRVLSDPDNPGRPALGIVYCTPSRVVLELLGAAPAVEQVEPPVVVSIAGRIAEPAPPDELVVKVRAAAAVGAERVYELWKSWRSAGAVADSASLLVAQKLLSFPRADWALEVLDTAGEGVRTKQLRALALRISGKWDEALQILRELYEAGQVGPETDGLLAASYKLRWLEDRDGAALIAAYGIYRTAFDRSGDTYNGINAAALALWRRRPEESRKLAQRVLDALGAKPEPDLDHWELATKAEALLLLGEIDDAREWYEKAVARIPNQLRDIEVMRKQARLDLAALGLKRNLVDSSLPAPRRPRKK